MYKIDAYLSQLQSISQIIQRGFRNKLGIRDITHRPEKLIVTVDGSEEFHDLQHLLFSQISGPVQLDGLGQLQPFIVQSFQSVQLLLKHVILFMITKKLNFI